MRATWKAGVPEGKGRATYANGLVYEGDFKAAKIDGHGQDDLSRRLSSMTASG